MLMHNSSAPQTIGRTSARRVSASFAQSPRAVSVDDVQTFRLLDANFSRTFTAAGNAIDHTLTLGNLPAGHSGLISVSGAVVEGNVLRNIQANASVQVDVGAPGMGVQVYTQRQTAPASTTVGTGYVAGTLGAHVMNYMLGMVDGLTQSNAIQQLYSSRSYNNGAPTVTFNNSLFFDRSELLGMALFDDTQNNREPVVVSPRHAILAWHVSNVIGRRFVFENADGSFITPLVVSKVDIPNVDISVLEFDHDLPFTPFKVMPEGWMDRYAPTLTDANVAANGSYLSTMGIPILRKSGHYPDGTSGECFNINFVVGQYDDTSLTNISSANGAPFRAQLSAWGASIGISGDSGGPSFMRINGEWVLICSQGTTATAADISRFIPEINAAMGNYTLQHPDLSGFTRFA